MFKIIATILYNSFKLKNPPVQLGRWCHLNYSKNCNLDIKSHFANVDNSSNNTGLCKTCPMPRINKVKIPSKSTSRGKKKETQRL